ncbi:MAG: DotI/IcmL family type IV secretion protein, partial [Deltaproteobacteria bacterium]|nr:DotI/IcmL family type IV secretion protein [Deltaproteobacteria bacterium]
MKTNEPLARKVKPKGEKAGQPNPEAAAMSAGVKTARPVPPKAAPRAKKTGDSAAKKAISPKVAVAQKTLSPIDEPSLMALLSYDAVDLSDDLTLKGAQAIDPASESSMGDGPIINDPCLENQPLKESKGDFSAIDRPKDHSLSIEGSKGDGPTIGDFKGDSPLSEAFGAVNPPIEGSLGDEKATGETQSYDPTIQVAQIDNLAIDVAKAMAFVSGESPYLIEINPDGPEEGGRLNGGQKVAAIDRRDLSRPLGIGRQPAGHGPSLAQAAYRPLGALSDLDGAGAAFKAEFAADDFVWLDHGEGEPTFEAKAQGESFAPGLSESLVAMAREEAAMFLNGERPKTRLPANKFTHRLVSSELEGQAPLSPDFGSNRPDVSQWPSPTLPSSNLSLCPAALALRGEPKDAPLGPTANTPRPGDAGAGPASADEAPLGGSLKKPPKADPSIDAEFTSFATQSLKWFLLQNKLIFRLSLALALSLLFMAGLCCCLAFFKPEPRYYWVTNDLRIMEMAPLNGPPLNDSVLVNFAAQTLREALSLDYLHWRKTLDGLKENFTEKALAEFVDSLKAEGHIKKIEEEKLVLSCDLAGAPV